MSGKGNGRSGASSHSQVLCAKLFFLEGCLSLLVIGSFLLTIETLWLPLILPTVGDFVFAIQVLFLQVSSILAPPLVDPKVMQSGFGLIFYSGLANLGKILNCRRISPRILPANFSRELFLQGFSLPKKNHQNSRQKLSAFLSNFTFWAFLGPTSFHAVFCAYGGDQHWYVQFVRFFVHNFHYLQLTFSAYSAFRCSDHTHIHTHTPLASNKNNLNMYALIHYHQIQNPPPSPEFTKPIFCLLLSLLLFAPVFSRKTDRKKILVEFRVCGVRNWQWSYCHDIITRMLKIGVWFGMSRFGLIPRNRSTTKARARAME